MLHRQRNTDTVLDTPQRYRRRMKRRRFVVRLGLSIFSIVELTIVLFAILTWSKSVSLWQQGEHRFQLVMLGGCLILITLLLFVSMIIAAIELERIRKNLQEL